MTQESDRQFEVPPLPRQISKYQIEGLLTKGGMSLLYLGSHPETNEPILVKVLLPKFLSESEICERFLNEARIIALTDHPNIIKLYDYGRWEHGLYIAMEFVKGSSLRKILAHQPFSLKRALEILLQISYALCHLHSHGVIHGDLKPENILIGEQGQVKVIDFGIAKLLGEKQPSQHRLVGTPIYMSPEQHQSYTTISFQSDIYSLGIIAYELIMGKISHGRVIISLAPRGLQKILYKALQPLPQDRYSDIVDFISDLSQYIKSGTFQKDKHGSDYFLELFEKLEKLQNDLLPQTILPHKGTEIGYVLRQGLGLSGLYCDFFDLDEERQALFIAEAQEKGAEGVFLASNIRTCLRTLLSQIAPLSNKEVLQKLRAQIPTGFFFSYLVIDTKAQIFEFFHNDYASLLHWSSGKIAHIHSKENGNQEKYQSQDRLFLLATKESQIKTEELITPFNETVQQPAQTQAESLLRKLRFKTDAFDEENPLCLIIILLK